jgi:flagellar hook-basal body complex protein FliE
MIIPPIGGLGAGGLSLGSTEAVNQGLPAGQAEGLGQAGGSEATGESGFGSELTEAISSLEKTQQSADGAAQALATGTVSDPESAVTTVEDAQMAMDLASQIRNKTTEAAQSIFQTQV